METTSILLSLALVLVVAAFVLRPIWVPAEPRIYENTKVHFLQARRARILTALADLDFDHSTGKIDQADYATERSQLIADGVDVLKQLDDATPTSSAIFNSFDTRSDTSIARIRQTESTPTAAEHLCPECDTVIRTNNRYCAQCGYTLNHEAKIP